MTEEKTILTYDSQQILDLIPHRYPFLLVDRIIANYLRQYKTKRWKIVTKQKTIKLY